MSVEISDKDTFVEMKAKAENPEVQYWIGQCYWRGCGIKQNAAEAVRWLKLAAEQGHVMAQRDMGYTYARGEGVTEDLEEATKWYKLAAEQGEVFAQLNLARC